MDRPIGGAIGKDANAHTSDDNGDRRELVPTNV
jgi:hypothetical protein